MRDLSLHLMDIVQNSITANAAHISILISADDDGDILTITVDDDGKGMDKDLLECVTEPFATTRTTRKIGMGLPLFKASAQRASGDLVISSVKGKGTSVSTSFKISHIDRPPLGDVAETIANVIMAFPHIVMKFTARSKNDEFDLDTLEVKKTLGDLPIQDFSVIEWIRDYINEGLRVIFGGVLDEIDS